MAQSASRGIAALEPGDRERHLVELIYGTLLDEGLWQTFVTDISSCHPNGHATLVYHDAGRQKSNLAITAGFEPQWIERYNAHFGARNPWMGRAVRRPVGEGVRSDQTLSRNKLLATEFYADFLRPQGISTGVGVTILRDEDSVFALSVVGSEVDDQPHQSIADLFGKLSPHLRRVFELHRRDLHDPLHTAQPLVERLDAAVLVVGPGRRLVKSNRFADTLLEQGRFVRHARGGRIVVDSGDVADALDASLIAPDAVCPGTWIARDRDGAAGRISLVGGNRSPIETFLGGPRTFLVVEPFDKPDRLTGATLRTLYRLTPAETRLMLALAEGLSLQEAAQRFDISRETARTQFRSICLKMGVGRQAEAVRLACLAGRGVVAPASADGDTDRRTPGAGARQA